MNYGTKQQKANARAILDLAEFDISRYEACASLNCIAWAHILQFRWLLRGVYLGPQNEPGREAQNSTEQPDRLHLLLQILKQPIPRRPERPLWSPVKYRSVRDLDIYSIWSARELFEKLPQAAEVCRRRDDESTALSSASEALPDLAYQSFHTYLLEQQVWEPYQMEPMLSVDLRAPDELIQAQFARWLQDKRAELQTRTARSPIPTKFTPADLRSWHDNRVLAFIDLDLLAYHLGLKLTNDMIADQLFPGEAGGEKIRKTVRPLAQHLMTPGTIDALDWQAGFECSPSGRT